MKGTERGALCLYCPRNPTLLSAYMTIENYIPTWNGLVTSEMYWYDVCITLRSTLTDSTLDSYTGKDRSVGVPLFLWKCSRKSDLCCQVWRENGGAGEGLYIAGPGVKYRWPGEINYAIKNNTPNELWSVQERDLVNYVTLWSPRPRPASRRPCMLW